jgi:hypothetical protein
MMLVFLKIRSLSIGKFGKTEKYSIREALPGAASENRPA